MSMVTMEALEQGGPDDRYNLWYVRYCAAKEQANYNAKGELRGVVRKK